MRQIRRIEIENFKSLVDFEVDLPKFGCLIGLNGSGKSSVLQLIDFLSQLVRGDMTGWLKERKWRSSELKSKLTKKTNITFQLHFSDEYGASAGSWNGVFNPSKLACVKERIELSDCVLEVEGGEAILSTKDTSPPTTKIKGPITFSYEGSILSALLESLLPPSLVEFKRYLAGIHSLDLLSPESLRQRTRESSGNLGLGGQNLAAFVHEMGDEKRRHLVSDLKNAYPRLVDVGVTSLRSGWKQLWVSENCEGHEAGIWPHVKTEARHVNDGMLRLIAILADLQSEHDFLLFDEIENGINPELVEYVLGVLTATPKQVVVTTHSPLILNYLDDETARESVIYLYKTSQGHTRAIPFFKIPSLAEKLTMMGPGEAFVDTNLTTLSAEIESLQEKH
jgi:ABC-type lipoprotein export system ATPase subunit